MERTDLKLEDLNPLKRTERAKELTVELWRAREFVRRGERHFAGDRRYDLQSVLDGFASRIGRRPGSPRENMCLLSEGSAARAMCAGDLSSQLLVARAPTRPSQASYRSTTPERHRCVAEDVHQFLS